MVKYCLLLLYAGIATSFVLSGQTSITPNIGLQVPSYGQTNYQVPLQYDLNLLDQYLSGNKPIPALTVTGTLSAPGFLPSSSSIISGLGYTPAADPGSNGLVYRTATGTSVPIAFPLVTKGDIFTWSSSPLGPARLPVGTDGQVPIADSSQALGIRWGTNGGGGTSPLTTKGDLFTFGTAAARFGIGTNGQSLVANSATSTGLQWQSTGSLNAFSYCTTPGSPDETCSNNAFSAALASTVILSSGITINNPINIPANKTLVLMPGTYVLGNNGNINMGTLSTLVCPGGPEQTIITVPSSYTRTDGIIVTSAGGVGTGATIQGCQVAFSQPSQSVRTSMIHYPPAIVGSQRLRIIHTKITEAWIGVDCTQADYCGGLEVDDMQISSYNYGFNIDNTADTLRLNNVHAWPFGLVLDSNKMIAYEAEANIGVRSGRCDDLEISNGLFFIGTGISLYTGTGPIPGSTFGTITGTGFDSFSGINMSAGSMAVSGSYFSVTGTYSSIIQSGGSLSLAGIHFNNNGGQAFIRMTGGRLQLSGGQVDLATTMSLSPFFVNAGLADFRMSNVEVDSGAVDQTIFTNVGGYLSLAGNRFFFTPNIVYATPKIAFGGLASRGTIADCTMDDLGSGSSVFMSVAIDSWIFIHDNSLLGSTISLPASPALIKAHDNF